MPIAAQKEYMMLSNYLIRDLPQTDPWPRLIRELAPVDKDDSELPELPMQDLLIEAVRRLRGEGESTYAFARRLETSVAAIDEIARGNPIGAMPLQRMLKEVGRKEQKTLPLEQLLLLFQEAAQCPRYEKNRVRSGVAKERDRLEMDDESIARHLGCLGFRHQQDMVDEFRLKVLDAPDGNEYGKYHRRLLIKAREKSSRRDQEERAM